MSSLSAQLYQGQQEINRMNGEIRTVVGMIQGLLSSLEEFQWPSSANFEDRIYPVLNGEKGLRWGVYVKDLSMRAIVCEYSGPSSRELYISRNKPDLHPAFEDTLTVYRSLDTLVEGLFKEFTPLERWLGPVLAAALVADK